MAGSLRRVLILQHGHGCGRGWEEAIGLLTETPELDLTFNDDGTVTVRWERSARQERDDFIIEEDSEVEVEEAAPF